jgi:signal transduction histidine kinase
MRRPWLVGIFFTLCVAVVFVAMAWVSVRAIRLDRDEADARRRIAIEEDARLALSRLDAMLAPILMQENARPYFLYRAFFSPQRAYTEMYAPIESSKILVPSPLLTHHSPHIILHFQIDPDGELSSPQVPQSNMRDVAESQFASHDDIVAAEAKLNELKRAMTRDSLLACLPAELSPMQRLERQLALRSVERTNNYSSRLGQRSIIEWQARNTAQEAYNDQQAKQKDVSNKIIGPLSDVTEGVMKAIWHNDALLLARRVTVNGKDYVQGCWLNWPAIEKWLSDGLEDVFPDARIVPISHVDDSPKPRMLASIPAKLIVNRAPLADDVGWSPIMTTLAIAWACMVLAAAAVGTLFVGAVKLSERRGAFVGAVTHELRTPLTTFRMYTEMLERKMVPDEDRRQEYLTTMRVEADRLSHLVENVLAYARLERSSPASRAQVLPVGGLIDRVKDRMTQRAEQAGMKLDVHPDGAAAEQVKADPGAVEQILFNLVDNACKYASSAKDRAIHVEASRHNGHVKIHVRDHGPGISRQEAKRLFQPFRKSAKDAAHSAPGVGLGLALSRRLAQAMGGDLRLIGDPDHGACFELTLPVVPPG